MTENHIPLSRRVKRQLAERGVEIKYVRSHHRGPSIGYEVSMIDCPEQAETFQDVATAVATAEEWAEDAERQKAISL